MSEYQYYEFQTVDRSLDADAQRALREVSSRAEITSTRFAVAYQWRGLRGDPRDLLARWFDAMVYVTNWGSRWVGFRLPKGPLADLVSGSWVVETVQVQHRGAYTIVDLNFAPEDGGEWTEGPGWLDRLLPLRDALLVGDLRCLYLGWLLDVEHDRVDEEALEPPVPAGLGQLDAALDAWVRFVDLDPDLLAAAAEQSGPLHAQAMDPAPLRATDAAQKDAWLLRVLDGDAATVRQELRDLLRRPTAVTPSARPRCVSALLERAAALRAARQAQEEAARAKAEQAAEARRQAALNARLDKLALREDGCWAEVDTLIQTSRPKEYDAAVAMLSDLRALADRNGTRAGWDDRVAELRARYGRRPSLIQRLDALQNPPEPRPGHRGARG